MTDRQPSLDERPLWEKLRGLHQMHTGVGGEIEQRAAALEAATQEAYSTGDEASIKRMLGCWARARRLWCDLTGEPLI